MFKQETKIKGAYLLQPTIFNDERGFFFESWNKSTFNELGINFDFVQDNNSRSTKNILRGLHYQTGESAQGKLVWVSQGLVFDVFVDLRQSSPTFGKWDGYIISGETHERLWIPPGCAHGFLVLSDVVDFHYKCSNYYNPKADRTLIWNDNDLDIRWPLFDNEFPILSLKDSKGVCFKDCEKYI
jgi:dTDP-4-dehydrorhamnose 3,5-epimerase